MTPSTMRKEQARMWSAMTLSELLEIGRVRLARGGGDQRLEQVDLVVGMHVLHHRRDALQAHAGVDEGLGSGCITPASSRLNCMNTLFQISM
jgi:hypothetical protein